MSGVVANSGILAAGVAESDGASEGYVLGLGFRSRGGRGTAAAGATAVDMAKRKRHLAQEGLSLQTDCYANSGIFQLQSTSAPGVASCVESKMIKMDR